MEQTNTRGGAREGAGAKKKLTEDMAYFQFWLPVSFINDLKKLDRKKLNEEFRKWAQWQIDGKPDVLRTDKSDEEIKINL